MGDVTGDSTDWLEYRPPGRPRPRPALVGGGQLPHRRPDLPPRQRAPARAADARPRQAAAARPLGHQPRPVDDLRAAQPGHPRDRHRLALRHRPGARRARAGRRRLARGHLLRGLPARRRRRRGVRTLFRQFSSPGGVPSHVSVQTPGSIHEGGELGYALAHAAGAAFDHPDLSSPAWSATARPRPVRSSASWRLPTFLNPRRDGAVLPILHLNGYKIAGPTRARAVRSDEDVAAYLRSQGWDPVVVAGDDPREVFPALYAALRAAHDRSGRSRPRPAPARPERPSGTSGRRSCCARRRAGPAPTSSTASRSRARTSARTRCRCPGWPRTRSTCGCSRSGCGRTDPESLFDDERPAGAGAAGAGTRGRPADVGHAVRQRRPAARGPADAGPRRATRSRSRRRASAMVENTASVGRADARPVRRHGTSRRRRHVPAVLARTRRRATGCRRSSRRPTAASWGRCCDTDDHLGADGRVMEVLSEHLCQGWLEGYRSPAGTACSRRTRRSPWSRRRWRCST